MTDEFAVRRAPDFGRAQFKLNSVGGPRTVAKDGKLLTVVTMGTTAEGQVVDSVAMLDRH
jgi:hypothetical protein